MINGFNALRVIPSLAVLFLAIPILGLSFWSAVLALTLLVMPPILISTDVAFRNIDPAIREAATGMGMPAPDILQQIEVPLALPVVISGIKTATVEVIASATLAAFVGAGGLGAFIVLGFAAYDPAIFAGRSSSCGDTRADCGGGIEYPAEGSSTARLGKGSERGRERERKFRTKWIQDISKDQY